MFLLYKTHYMFLTQNCLFISHSIKCVFKSPFTNSLHTIHCIYKYIAKIDTVKISAFPSLEKELENLLQYIFFNTSTCTQVI